MSGKVFKSPNIPTSSGVRVSKRLIARVSERTRGKVMGTGLLCRHTHNKSSSCHIFLFFIIVAFETFIKSVYGFNNAKSFNNNYKYHADDVYATLRKILCKKIDFRKENTKKY